jgi:hypothetical protein
MRVLLGAESRPTGMSALAALQRGGHVGRRELVGAQALRVEVDAHLRTVQPADVDARDARHALEPLAHDLVGQQRQLARAARRRQQRQQHRGLRVVAVEARDERRLRVAREARLHAATLSRTSCTRGSCRRRA